MGANEKHDATYHGGEYTPDADMIREQYVAGAMVTGFAYSRTEARTEFDRWLETVRAEAKAEALRDKYNEQSWSIQPVMPRVSEAVEAVLEAFETAYLEQQKSNQYPLTLTVAQETTLIAAIAQNLGNVPTPAKITEILSEVQDLHRLDGRCLEFEGEEYEPEDDGYRYALSDHEDNRRQFIRYLIHQQMK